MIVGVYNYVRMYVHVYLYMYISYYFQATLVFPTVPVAKAISLLLLAMTRLEPTAARMMPKTERCRKLKLTVSCVSH